MLLPGAQALADDLVASRTGLMCTSAEALAKLTLSDGSSRAASPHARPGDTTLEQQGGCIAIPPGAHVTLQIARRNTSIVTYDAEDGRGPRSFVVPNIDFGSGAASAAIGGCLRYDVPVTLSGRITRGSSYGEDNTGKVGWVHWRQITLDRPICTLAIPNTFEQAERNIRSIEPSYNETVNALPLGQRVTVAGKLFHADNGNQMTLVLIQVASIAPSH